MNHSAIIEKTTSVIFPYVSFTNVDGKEFCIERSRLLHAETYCYKDDKGRDQLDYSKTFVNFKSPNCKTKGSLHAIIAISLEDFRNQILQPAFEGMKTSV